MSGFQVENCIFKFNLDKIFPKIHSTNVAQIFSRKGDFVSEKCSTFENRLSAKIPIRKI